MLPRLYKEKGRGRKEHTRHLVVPPSVSTICANHLQMDSLALVETLRGYVGFIFYGQAGVYSTIYAI